MKQKLHGRAVRTCWINECHDEKLFWSGLCMANGGWGVIMGGSESGDVVRRAGFRYA